jgi:hypothetical protein
MKKKIAIHYNNWKQGNKFKIIPNQIKGINQNRATNENKKVMWSYSHYDQSNANKIWQIWTSY